MTTMMSDLFSVMCNRFSAYRWWQTGYWLLIMGYCLLITACANPGIECEDDLGCVEVGPDDSIQLGYLLALSGEAAYLGEDAWQAVELAMSQRGTLLGHPLELIGFDTGCDVAMGRSVAIEASDFSTILGIIGTTCSAVAEAVLPIISRAGMVMVSPTNTTANVPQLDDELGQLSYFRTAPNELWQAEVAASFAREELRVQTAAILYDTTPYSNNLRQTFADAFTALGGSVILQPRLVPGGTDINDVLALLVGNQPDLLYLPLFEPEANYLLNNLLENSNWLLLGTDSLMLPSFAESTGTAARGLYLTGTAVSGPAYDDFLAQWLALYDTTPSSDFAPHAYDAANILLDAIERAAQVGNDNSLLIGRLALRQAIADTTRLNGVTGQLTCQASECGSRNTLGIYQITDAQVTSKIWPPTLIWQP
jgi:branched-chain amino acid transport system substrate-binding protein